MPVCCCFFVFFTKKNYFLRTPLTLSTVDKSFLWICFGMSYRCVVRFRKFQCCPGTFSGWKMTFLYKTSGFKNVNFAIAKWSTRIWLRVSCWRVIWFHDFQFYHGGRLATRNDVLLQKKYGSQNSCNLCSSYIYYMLSGWGSQAFFPSYFIISDFGGGG